jgi:hypothetical protein
MSSSSLPPSSTPTDSSSPIPTTSGGGGTPPTATLLFGFLVIFAALFAGFLFLALFWKLQRRRQIALPPELGEISGTHTGVPRLWEAWIRDEPSEKQWNWESISVSCCKSPNPRRFVLPSSTHWMEPLFGSVAPYCDTQLMLIG